MINEKQIQRQVTEGYILGVIQLAWSLPITVKFDANSNEEIAIMGHCVDTGNMKQMFMFVFKLK